MLMVIDHVNSCSISWKEKGIFETFGNWLQIVDWLWWLIWRWFACSQRESWWNQKGIRWLIFLCFFHGDVAIILIDWCLDYIASWCVCLFFIDWTWPYLKPSTISFFLVCFDIYQTCCLSLFCWFMAYYGLCFWWFDCYHSLTKINKKVTFDAFWCLFLQ